MDDQSVFGRLLVLVEKYQLPLILGLLGVIFIGLGFLGPVLNNSKKEPLVVESAKENEAKVLKVDVSGAVKVPGVYSLKEGSRILDAIYEAGGFNDQVDADFVAKSINLAEPVADGQKIYIGTISDAIKPTSSTTLGSVSVAGKINVNTASAKELDTLPGVGSVTAEKIISGRPYKSVDELLSKKAVGKATYEKIKDQISVY